jgi:hypothetical protein
VGAELFHANGRTEGRTDVQKRNMMTLIAAFVILRTHLKTLQVWQWKKQELLLTFKDSDLENTAPIKG